jgi:repressor LexA
MESVEQQPKKEVPAGVDGDTGGRIKQLFEHYRLSTYEANQKLGYARSSKLYKVLSGDVKPSYETTTDLLSAFPEVSAEWLLMGKGPMLRSAQPDSIVQADPIELPRPAMQLQRAVFSNAQIHTVTVDRTGNETTMLVPLAVQAGYPTLCNEAVYLQDMKSYELPGFEFGEYRAFEVDGDSMSPTFRHRDIVVCKNVDRLDLLKPDECYVIVTSENLLLKRIPAVITDRRGTFELHSDNPAFKPYKLPVADLQQLWIVRGYLSTNIPGKPDHTAARLMERLQEVIELLGHDYNEVRQFLNQGAAAQK